MISMMGHKVFYHRTLNEKFFEWPQRMLSSDFDEIAAWNMSYLEELSRYCGTVFFSRCFMMKHFSCKLYSPTQLFQT